MCKAVFFEATDSIYIHQMRLEAPKENPIVSYTHGTKSNVSWRSWPKSPAGLDGKQFSLQHDGKNNRVCLKIENPLNPMDCLMCLFFFFFPGGDMYEGPSDAELRG